MGIIFRSSARLSSVGARRFFESRRNQLGVRSSFSVKNSDQWNITIGAGKSGEQEYLDKYGKSRDIFC